MCFQISSVRSWGSWNWSGDEIVHNPIVRACRSIPGGDKRYDIDIREFLTTTDNAVVHQSLEKLVKGLAQHERSLFGSHSPGSFDFRADKVMQYVSQLRYLEKANVVDRCPDAWLYPDETLAQGGGDCEDLALLSAALLMAAGISDYCVRVALGSVHIGLSDEKIQKHDHCWVMYQNESGIWEILEPLCAVAPASAKAAVQAMPQRAPVTEYVPHYVFNTDHLWLIDSRDVDTTGEFNDYCRRRSFWNKFDPSFAASVHATIFDKALSDLVSQDALSRMKRKSLWLDANIFTYDPCDHFDNGYIDDGWAKVNERLAGFRKNNSDWESFGAAGHSIGDFYAHSSYAHFALLQDGDTAQVYQPGVQMVVSPSYTANAGNPQLSGFDLTSGQFSTNPNLWQGSPQQRADNWAGKLISGRYAQRYDPQATFWDGLTSIPQVLAGAPDFAMRGSLPHHDEIAVDEEVMGGRHKLYSKSCSGPGDRQAYVNQFRWRMNTAIRHIRQAFRDNSQVGITQPAGTVST